MSLKTKEVTIGGEKYTLQAPPIRERLKMTERCKNKNGHLIQENWYDEMFKHVIISPKKTIDDFENFEELTELMQECNNFLGK